MEIKYSIPREYLKDLYNKYKNLIYWIGYDEMGNHYVAEEIVQETFIKAAKYIKKSKCKNDVEERNYISRIARNTAHTFYKKRSRAWNNITDINEMELSEDTAELANPESFNISNDSVEIIVGKLRELDKKYLDPLMLQKRDKLTIEEIADVLGVSPSCVTKRLKKAKKMLKEVLIKEGICDE